MDKFNKHQIYFYVKTEINNLKDTTWSMINAIILPGAKFIYFIQN